MSSAVAESLDTSGRLRGQALARALWRCWDREPATVATPPCPATLTLGRVSGVGSLLASRRAACPRWIPSDLRRDARLIAIESHRRQRDLLRVFAHLRSAGIEPILVKGWSVARSYACPERRPLGDLDLCVEPEALTRAVQAARELNLPANSVDLHAGVPDLCGERWADLYARSQLAPLHGEGIRVLHPVDLFRLVCMHFVRHLGSRPLWLVDVAVLLESYRDMLAQEIALIDGLPAGEWLHQVAHLAHTLLGARSPWPPPREVPEWLAPSVLWLWGHVGAMPPLREIVRTRAELADALRFRWWHPTRAVWRLGLSPTTPLWRIHLGSLMARPWQGAVRLCRALSLHRSEGSVAIHEHRTF